MSALQVLLVACAVLAAPAAVVAQSSTPAPAPLAGVCALGLRGAGLPGL